MRELARDREGGLGLEIRVLNDFQAESVLLERRELWRVDSRVCCCSWVRGGGDVAAELGGGGGVFEREKIEGWRKE